jgi:hypothetical protein
MLRNPMQRNLGLPVSSAGLPSPFAGEKLVIDVSVMQTPGVAAPWFNPSNHFGVPSPAVYLAPSELTDAELLAQSIVFPLLAHVLAQASDQHQIGAAWQPLLGALHLWQVWDLELPLSAWQKEVVQWLYIDLPASRPGAVVLPEHYTALCAAHKLWLPSPAQLNIPLVCTGRDWEHWLFSSWGPRDPLTRLDQLAVPVRPGKDGASSRSNQVHHPGQTVALATLIEYVVATYGRKRLPALVAGLGQYDSWDTLIPAVYGVSPAEFEAGWQAYLKAHYGIISAH